MAKGYLQQVGAAYQRSLDREALFEGLESRIRSEERRSKLRLLQQLEAESRALLRPILACEGTRRPAAGIRRGVRASGERRWIEFVDTLGRELVSQVALLERLERSSPKCDQKSLARVTAHLIAIQSFARLEVAGRAGEAIQPAQVLIRHCAGLPLAVAAG